MGSRLKFRQLRLLVALDDSRSLRKAADLMALTQPGTSKALKEIESTFGAELFTRTAQGLMPNELGRCVIRHARLMKTNLDHLHEEMSGVVRGQGGRISVGTIAGALPILLNTAVARIKRETPNVSIEVFEGTSAQLLLMLAEGKLDMALCRTSVAPLPDLYEFEWLAQEKVNVAFGPRHPLANEPSLKLEQLLGYPWVLFPSHMPLRTLLERELANLGLEPPAHSVETSSTFASVLLLQNELNFIAMFSEDTVSFFDTHGLIKKAPVEIQSRVESYGVATRRGSMLSAAADVLLRYVIECHAPQV